MRLATRGLGQRGTRSRVVAEARPRGRLEVVGLEALVVEALGVLGFGDRLRWFDRQGVTSLVQVAVGQRGPSHENRADQHNKATDGDDRHAGLSGARCARSSPWADEHGGRAERDAGETGNQMEPVHACVHQPDDQRPPRCYREPARPRVARGLARSPREAQRYRNQECREQEPSDDPELAKGLQLEAVRLADVLARAPLEEVGAVEVAGPYPANRIVGELAGRHSPVVVAVAASCGEAR